MNWSNTAPRYNYGEKKEDKPLIATLEESKIENFKVEQEKYFQKIERKYGTPRLTNTLNLQQFTDITNSMKYSRFEGFLIYTASTNIINYKFYRVAEEDEGSDSVATLKVAVTDRLKIEWVKRFNVFDHRFEMEYREKDGFKYVSLKKDFSYQTKFKAKYLLVIREVRK